MATHAGAAARGRPAGSHLSSSSMSAFRASKLRHVCTPTAGFRLASGQVPGRLKASNRPAHPQKSLHTPQPPSTHSPAHPTLTIAAGLPVCAAAHRRRPGLRATPGCAPARLRSAASQGASSAAARQARHGWPLKPAPFPGMALPPDSRSLRPLLPRRPQAWPAASSRRSSLRCLPGFCTARPPSSPFPSPSLKPTWPLAATPLSWCRRRAGAGGAGAGAAGARQLD